MDATQVGVLEQPDEVCSIGRDHAVSDLQASQLRNFERADSICNNDKKRAKRVNTTDFLKLTKLRTFSRMK